MIKAIIEKLKIKEIVGISFCSALIITILPNEIISYIRLVEIREKYQMYISLCLIITSAYYIFNIFGFIGVFLMRKLVNEKNIAIKYMRNHMSGDEMELLIQTFHDNSNNTFKSSGYIEYSDGRKAALESKCIIYLASSMSNINNYRDCAFAYNLQPYTREFSNNKLKNGDIKIENDSFKYRLD